MKELTKDKYLALVLVVLLLTAYVITRDTVLQTLLITAVGGFLGLVRSGSSTNITSEGAPVSFEAPAPPAKQP